MTTKSSDIYGRSLDADAPPGELEVASGVIAVSDKAPVMVFVAFIGLLILIRMIYEAAE